jgi:hypothetical protein
MPSGKTFHPKILQRLTIKKKLIKITFNAINGNLPLMVFLFLVSLFHSSVFAADLKYRSANFETVKDTSDLRITGIVKSRDTQLPVGYCNVIILHSSLSANTNEKGEFEIFVPETILSPELIFI